MVNETEMYCYNLVRGRTTDISPENGEVVTKDAMNVKKGILFTKCFFVQLERVVLFR
jgi:hypothetical protein